MGGRIVVPGQTEQPQPQQITANVCGLCGDVSLVPQENAATIGEAHMRGCIGPLVRELAEKVARIEAHLMPTREEPVGEGWSCGGCGAWIPAGLQGSLHLCKGGDDPA